jgi:Protein of unknown function (DUF4012)
VTARAGGLRNLLDDDFLVVIIALIAGLVAALGPAEPTGHTATDAILLALGTGLIVFCGALAPWWVSVVVAAAAMAIALDPLLIGLAVVALALALWNGSRPSLSRVVTAASLGLSFNVLGRADVGGMLGTSAIVTFVAAALVFVTGIGRRSTPVRRTAWIGLGVVVVFGGLATAGFAYEAAKSRHELASGLSTAELGVAALEDGRFEDAAGWFREATGYLESANDRLDKPWARAAAVVPVAAIYQSAVSDMSHVGADGATVVADALDEIDFDRLRPQAGRFDLQALADLQSPLTWVRDALVDLQQTSQDVRSPWLVDRATYELDDFDESVAEHLPALQNALQAIELAPEMLGADGPRTYLLLFTTPSESRALGGFIGSYAELTVTDGQLVLGDFGRAQDLDAAVVTAAATMSDHEEFVQEFGRFGYDTDGNGAVGDAAFRNLDLTANFPWVGEIATELYTKTTGHKIDGVIAMDPHVVGALLGYTGTVHLDSLNQDVTPENAVQFLLRDQYVIGAADNDVRADGLAEAASQAFKGLIGGALPEPIELARDLGPLTSERRLLVWSAHEEEQELLETVDIAGEMPALDGADGWSFSVSNTGGNKIDAYLQRKAGYDATTDADTDVTTGTMSIELTNTAPAEGLPNYVIGNRIGKPLGTSSLLVTLYSPLGLEQVTVNGAVVGVTPGTEDGWNAYRFSVDIPAGETATIDAALSGKVADPGELVTWTQPMADQLQPL